MSTYPPRHKNPFRPYHKRVKEFGYSVTTALNTLGGGAGLKHGAVNETAAFVLDFPEEWQHLPRDEAFLRITRHFQGLWDGRKEMGTVLHSVMEAWCDGEEADLAELIHAAVNREKSPVRIWEGREDYIVAELAGYVDGLELFWRDFEPEVIATEEIVRHVDPVHPYIGTRDLTAKLRGLDGVTLIDAKTTAKQYDPAKPDGGLYWEKFRLQLAALRYAKEIVHFDEDKNIVATFPAYRIDRCCILHLRGDGRYQLLQCQAGGDEWATFLRQLDLHRWVSSGCKKPPAVDLTPQLAMREEVA